MRRLLVLTLIFGAACAPKQEKPSTPPPPPPARLVIADSAIKTPESVLYDPADDMYLVSNINGGPLDKDNNGFISHVMPGGMIHVAHFIQGGAKGITLNAPKGMGIKGDSLFVADIDQVRVFSRTTGALIANRPIPGAIMLNDVAVGPDGTVYVTDTGVKMGPKGFVDAGSDAVYRFGAGGKAIALARGAALGHPNGLTVTDNGIVVVTFGSGEVYRLDAKTGAKSVMPKPPKGQLDGVEMLADGSFLISSWEGAAVYRLSNGVYTTAIDSVTSPADIGYDRKRGMVLIPIFTGNKIEVREVR